MHRKSVRRTVTATAVGLAATVALTACQASGSSDSNGKGGSSSTAAPSSDSSSGSSANSSSGSGSSSGNGSHTSSTSSKASTCRTSNLRITATNQGEARQGLGSILITFTNTGSSCRMYGFPGVDLKTNYGTQSVDRNKQEVGTPFTLKAGKRATANVVYPINNTGGSGVQGTALVVTPPNETHHVTVPVGVSLPVSDTDKGHLEVTPVFEEH
ncbi:hypothetical protein CG747_44555 [Streptomyces sp. CB02959]|uniref:DUF4232 domain-containing protein n=1 Tax=Streptomyces sp. CB02959 TaxID=2020330 RepID=UPI000C270F14|nr:DUF4232 domain-containing protein [Streptomyces sp. CB02959]PJN31576.1 hypothetical protein CG747_44555 [Streptomyces sp. CB02959]